MGENSKNIREELEKLTTFPAMPELANKILALGPHPEINDLVPIVEIDPGLAAQVVRQATSPYFGYRGKVKSVRDAITRVLGVERAMSLAIGVAAGKALRCPADGPIGRKAIWVHAAYSAALMQCLAETLPEGNEISLGMCYLAGLMHNIGFLLLGHIFPADLHALNKAIIDHPKTSIADLEQRMLGTDHAEIGTWLMSKWSMPGEVITTVLMHHNANYRGQYAIYANLALLADHMLKRIDIGDGASEELPPDLVNAVGIDEREIMGVFQNLLEARSDLDSLAKYMATAA